MAMSQPGAQTFSDRALASWNRFWFTPADPTVLEVPSHGWEVAF